MRNQRITDTDAAAVMGGSAPADRPELADVATALSEFRLAAFESLPQPSAELRERLERGVPGGATTRLSEGTKRASAGGVRRRRFGVAAVVMLGSAMALAGVTTAGAAGVLPGGVQVAFDAVVEKITGEPVPVRAPLDTTVDEPVNAPEGDESVPTDEPTREPDAVVPGESVSPEPSASASPTTPGSGSGGNNDSGDKKDDKAEEDKAKKDKAEKEKAEREKADKAKEDKAEKDTSDE